MKRPTRYSCTCIFLLWYLLAQTLEAQVSSPLHKQLPSLSGVSKTSQQDQRSIIDINNLWARVRSDGAIYYDPVTGQGVTYPQQTGGLVYADNLIWVGKVEDGGSPELRTGGGIYIAGVRAGAITGKGIAEDPASPAVRVYRIRPDYEFADLTLDAAGCFGVAVTDVTPAMVDGVRGQYAKDWTEWPWQKGAPFCDKNGNGLMDPGETPGLQDADQVAWLVYNDLDESVSRSFYGDPPVGLEVQETLWGYKGIPMLQDVVFKRYRLIYKGTGTTAAGARIDSLYLTLFSDPDVGNAGNDLGGCDSLLSLGFAYSSAPPYGGDYDPALGISPGVGYALLQGPLVPAGQDESGVFDFGTRAGKKNLPMTSFSIHITGGGDGLNLPPSGTHTFWFWNVARGFRPPGGLYDSISTTMWYVPGMNPTTFMCSGDPATRTGWYAGSGDSRFLPLHNGDVRLYMNTGPFAMALGDTQEVVVALMASPAADGPQNAPYLRYTTAHLRTIYPDLAEYASGFKTVEIPPEPAIPNHFTLEQNFPNPFNPSTTIRYSLPIDANVKLAIYDVLGREIRVLQGGVQAAGTYSLIWDSRDSENRLAPSGIYLYRLTAGHIELVRKMVVVR